MPKKNRASGPKIRGVQKSKKRSFFGIKNVKNFETRHQIFFSQKIFNPPMRPKRHFALKDTFPIETIGKKKKNAKIPKISKNLLSYFSKKKRKQKNRFFFSSAPAVPRHLCFFFRRLRRLFFFSIGK